MPAVPVGPCQVARPVRRPAPGMVPLTHPDKVLWPEDGITKQDLADYYQLVAPRLIDAVGGRPVAIVRAPEGIDGPRFFQRHASRGMPAAIHTVRVSGHERPFLQVDDEEGLTALAQLAAVELHPWCARSDDIAHPDRLVFDLDPAEDLGFESVVAAALLLRNVLEGLGLFPFPRTTGGKGLHLVVPLRPGAGWDAARGFARTVCEHLARLHPDAFTTRTAKQARTGRIFLDYLRNDPFASAIACWSVRARPGAPIAMPLSWRELRPGLRPGEFTLRAARRLMRRADPWQGLAAAAGTLPKSPAGFLGGAPDV